MSTITGQLTAIFHNPSTLSSPPLSSIFILDEDGYQYDFFAKGKLSRRIALSDPKPGSLVTLTHEGHHVTEFKEIERAQ